MVDLSEQLDSFVVDIMTTVCADGIVLQAKAVPTDDMAHVFRVSLTGEQGGTARAAEVTPVVERLVCLDEITSSSVLGRQHSLASEAASHKSSG